MLAYDHIIAAIETRSVFPKIRPCTEKIEAALAASGLTARLDPQRIIVVAGTNGKGSTCATLEALLLAAGQTTGLFTSPHLISVTERMRVNGVDIPKEDFVRLYHALEKFIMAHDLTHFEILTLMAAKWFLDSRLDWMIFEIGMGGLGDASNAIPHQHCVITPIDFDHMHILGKTLPEIAAQKFGIVGQGNSVAFAPLPIEIAALQRRVQHDTNSTWIPRRDFGYHVIDDNTQQPHFMMEWEGRSAELALPGLRGAENAALAMTVCETLGFDPLDYLHGLKNVRWPGRMERITMKNWPCPVFLSGDHNLHGIKSLLEILPHYSRKTLHILAGIGDHKNVDEMLQVLSAIPDSRIYLTRTTFKGRPLEEYGDWLSKAFMANEDYKVLLEHLRQTVQKGDLIVVTGSLYLVGAVRARLLSQARRSGTKTG